MRKVLLVELNEVPFRVIDDYCRKQPRSALATLLARCQQLETHAEDRGHLSPWVTWPSVHRGVDNQAHGIGELGQDLSHVDREYPSIWEIAKRQGKRVGVFGSLHSAASEQSTDLSRYSFFVGDSFATDDRCFPESLRIFQTFNLAMVHASAKNVSSEMALGPALRMLAQTPKLGLTCETLLRIGRQLLDELVHAERRTRRRSFQMVLSFDVFFEQLQRTQPDFVTFFTNHVASAMHRYWAACYPGDYQEVGFSGEWITTYRSEIDFAMQIFDHSLRRLVAWVDDHPEYELWIASSMGQAATSAQPVRTLLKLHDPRAFFAKVGLADGDWEIRPAMFPQVNVVVAPDKRASFRTNLAALRIEDAPLPFTEHDGMFSIVLGHPNLPDDARLSELGLSNMLIQDETAATAYHVPQGSLLVYRPGHPANGRPRRTVSTLELAPAILERLSCDVPGYMRKSSGF